MAALSSRSSAKCLITTNLGASLFKLFFLQNSQMVILFSMTFSVSSKKKPWNRMMEQKPTMPLMSTPPSTRNLPYQLPPRSRHLPLSQLTNLPQSRPSLLLLLPLLLRNHLQPTSQNYPQSFKHRLPLRNLFPHLPLLPPFNQTVSIPQSPRSLPHHQL